MTQISDETLTAFLDGELSEAEAAQVSAALSDPVIAARLDALNFPVDQLAGALAPVRLDAPQMPRAVSQRPSFAWPVALAATFALGIGIGALAMRPAPADWIEAVAAYQVLYVPETLSAPRQDPGQTDTVLTQASAEFDIDLTATLTLDDVSFKRAQMLGFNGAPLLQIAYLTPAGAPVALCITRVSEGSRMATTAQIQGLETTSWVQDGIGFVLIGGDAPLHQPARTEVLQALLSS